MYIGLNCIIMDKFAVDLEKVLDEFEFNEEREEQVQPIPGVRCLPMPPISQVPSRPPAASYRRPSFEPINLADADYAAATPAQCYANATLKHSSQAYSLVTSSNYVSPTPASFVTNALSGYECNVNARSMFTVEARQEQKTERDAGEEKPDLLDYGNNNEEDMGVPTQLPDVTTTTPTLSISGECDSERAAVFDLIQPSETIVRPVTENDLAVQAVGFESSNVSDSELQLYLQQLEELEGDSELPSYDEAVLINFKAQEPERIDSFNKKLNDAFDKHNAIESSIEAAEVLQPTEQAHLFINSSPSHDLEVMDKLRMTTNEAVSDRNILEEIHVESKATDLENGKDCECGVTDLTSVVDGGSKSRSVAEQVQLSMLEESNTEVAVCPQKGIGTTILDEGGGKAFDQECSEELLNSVGVLEENVTPTLDHHSKLLSLDCSNEHSLDAKEISEYPQEVVKVRDKMKGRSKNGVNAQMSNASQLQYHFENIDETLNTTAETNKSVNEQFKPQHVTISTVTRENVNQMKFQVEKEKDEVDERVNYQNESMSIASISMVDEPEENDSSNYVQNQSKADQEYNSDDKKLQWSGDNEGSFQGDEQVEDVGSTLVKCEPIGNGGSIEEQVLCVMPEQTCDSVTMSDKNWQIRCSENEEGRCESDKQVEGLVSETDRSEAGEDREEEESDSGPRVDEERFPRPNFLPLPFRISVSPEDQTPGSATSLPSESESDGVVSPVLGKVAPFWIPDVDAATCMQCQAKFTVIKRRHHCRACGQVLCSKCCGLKSRLEYMDFSEARVCQPCFASLEKVVLRSPLGRQPNPNNPMEYCSTIPPLQQALGTMHQPPPSVLVPTSVLKREGRVKSDVAKQVIFSDGIRPGGDLTELDGSGEARVPFRRPGRLVKRVGTPPGGPLSRHRPLEPSNQSFIPPDAGLPPTVTRTQGETCYIDTLVPITVNDPPLKFAINRNLYLIVKRVLLDCCVNRECWCLTSEGLACVGQDEVVFVLECLPQETEPPRDAFLLINHMYQDASKGSTVSELSFTPAWSSMLFGSRDHGGFLYIRASFQCTTQLILPQPPYLVALLVHSWETPWARLFPIRLVLRLGAEFRYYPCPLVSVRNRQALYSDIGHTIINLLADFRQYSYTLPSVRGLVIHMEDRQTTIVLPKNRYDQVARALNNSNESVLAFGANLSLTADSHLVCMQSTEDEATYHSQAINIHNKPRRVTGASFVVLNGALKAPGLAGKSSIVEDGLMVQIPSESMTALRAALKDMRDFSIGCGPNAQETVLLHWDRDDTNFNIGVKSCIDGRPLDGVPSIRVHNGTDYSGSSRIIRWTEVFILQCEESSSRGSDPLDISRVSESLARATCLALVPLLDLLSAASLSPLALRATIHPDNVGYEAGSKGEKLPPLYMKSLDEELVAVVHQAALAAHESPATLELVFRVMDQ